jgi:hypothetical protein
MRLKKAHREALLKWIAEGLESDEINKRAAKFKPPFKVLRSQVVWYRKTRGIKLDEIQEEGEVNALTTGFALKENRVAALQKLADKMMGDLMGGDKMWLLQVKGIGSHDNYERVEYWEFNRSEVESLRGVLDDIASEVGERIRKTDLTSGGKPLPRPGIDPKQLKNLSNDELIALETAAEILERSGADQDPAVKS